MFTTTTKINISVLCISKPQKLQNGYKVYINTQDKWKFESSINGKTIAEIQNMQYIWGTKEHKFDYNFNPK